MYYLFAMFNLFTFQLRLIRNEKYILDISRFLHLLYDENKTAVFVLIGGFRGGAPGARPPKGPNSFILTYKFYET